LAALSSLASSLSLSSSLDRTSANSALSDSAFAVSASLSARNVATHSAKYSFTCPSEPRLTFSAKWHNSLKGLVSVKLSTASFWPCWSLWTRVRPNLGSWHLSVRLRTLDGNETKSTSKFCCLFNVAKSLSVKMSEW